MAIFTLWNIMFHDIIHRFCLISRNLYPCIFATCCYLVCYVLYLFPAAICCVCESYSEEEKRRRQCFQSFGGRCRWCPARWILPSVAGGVLLMVGQAAAWHNRLQPCAMFHTLRNVDNITCCVSVWMRLYNNQTFAGSDLSLFGTGNETHPPPDYGGSWFCYSRKNFFSKIRVKKNNNQKKSGGWKCEKFVKINFGV